MYWVYCFFEEITIRLLCFYSYFKHLLIKLLRIDIFFSPLKKKTLSLNLLVKVTPLSLWILWPYSYFILVLKRFQKSPEGSFFMLTISLDETSEIDSSCHIFPVMHNNHGGLKETLHVIRLVFKSRYSTAFWESFWTHHVSSHIHYSIKWCFMLGYTHTDKKQISDRQQTLNW